MLAARAILSELTTFAEVMGLRRFFLMDRMSSL